MLDLWRARNDQRLRTMTGANFQVSSAPVGSSWSNRGLLLSLAGIFLLTLYPFRVVDQHSARFLFPFLLDGWGKAIKPLDIFLNVVLFVPFGFGLAEKLRERGWSRFSTILMVYAVGALLSYAVEFVQIYIPMRDSGWGDVISNSSGAAVGAVLFGWLGATIIAWSNACERALDSWLSLGKIGMLVAIYVGFWCVLAGALQKQTRLAGWTPDSFLVIGNSASLRPDHAWKGRIRQLEIWNDAVTPDLGRRLTGHTSEDSPSPGAIVAYRFSGVSPFQDLRHFLPSLAWTSQAPSSSPSAEGAILGGKSWLISAGPVPMLTRAIESRGQFALHVVCESAELHQNEAFIVSLSSPSGSRNLELRQDDSSLAFWFRNPFSKPRHRMSLVVPQIFAAHRMSDLLLSFDGTKLSLFVDGRDYDYPYEFGPGVALARYIRRVKAAELKGYDYVLYASIFFPAGGLLGFAWRRSNAFRIVRLCFLASGFLLPAVVLEWVLADASGRAMSLHNIWFSALLAVAASLWINADRVAALTLGGRREPVAPR